MSSPPSVLSSRAEPRDVSTRDAQRMHQALRVLWMVLASYGVDTALLGLLAWAGAVDSQAALVMGVGGVLVFAGFRLAFSMGLSRRFRDHYLTVPQMAASSGIFLAVAAWFPAVNLLLLILVFVVFAFAALRLELRQLVPSWFVITLGIAWVVGNAPAPPSLPGATPLQAALSAVWLSLVLGRCALVGLFGSSLRQHLVRRTRALSDATGQLEYLAMRDPLTSALNRRAIMQALDAALLDAHGRAAGGIAVVLVDLDRFKAINDLHGHPVGDEVLRRVVAALGCMMRSVDRLGRHGGEEFLIVLPSTASAEAALRVAERLREAIRTQPWADIVPGLRVTASFGVVYALTDDTSHTLLERADEALYRAKREGRDRVRLAL
jgi:diguanylate cyclase